MEDKKDKSVDIGFESERVDTTAELNIEIGNNIKSLVRHETDLKRSLGKIDDIHDFITAVKKEPSQFLKYTSDKEYVIFGTVTIAIVAIFWIPDPGNVVMAIVTGLFGLATGRAMSNKDNK